MSTQHRRDADALLDEPVAGTTVGLRVAASAAKPRHSHDGGSDLEQSKEAPPPAPVAAAPVQKAPVVINAAPRPEQKPVVVRAAEEPEVAIVRSHDRGVTLETPGEKGGVGTRTPAPPVKKKEDAATIGSFLFSFIELGGATAQFTFDQVQTGFRLLRHPLGALDILEHAIQSYTKGLEYSVDEARKMRSQ